MSESEKMAMLHRAMLGIDSTCARMPSGSRPYLGNALLNLALGYLIELHGQPGTASLLSRVVAALGAGELPNCPAQSLDAVRLNS